MHVAYVFEDCASQIRTYWKLNLKKIGEITDSVGNWIEKQGNRDMLRMTLE